MTSSFIDWLTRLLTHGESVQVEQPVENAADQRAILECLSTAFGRLALDVAGPPIAFDARTAFSAAFILARACWHLVAPEEDEPLPLHLEAEPASPSAHLSADVVLRFLPAIHH